MSGPGPVIDGSPSSGATNQADGELVVYGHGIGSTLRVEVTTEDVRRCADEVRALASRLLGAVQMARGAAVGVSATAHMTTGSGAMAADAAWEVVGDVERRVDEVTELAGRLHAIAQKYEAAEAANAAMVWKVVRPSGPPLAFPWLHLAHVWGLVATDAWRHGQLLPTRHGIGLGLEETFWAMTGLDPAVAAVDRRLADLIDHAVNHEVEVRQVDAPARGAPDAGADPPEPIADLEGVVTAIEDLYPDNGLVEAGTVRIDRVTGVDGSQSWLVLVPGTQGALLADHGFDWASNPGAMLGETTASTAVVVQAMRLAGIRPGQPVMIAGHSQGGLVAVNAANAMSEEVDVTGVLTLGAPTGLLESPPGSEVLSIEHVEDLVPGLDNTSNDVSDRWTTVERTLHDSAEEDASDLWWPGTSHDTPAYADTARLVDASGDAALDGFFTGVEGVLDADATVESYYFQGTRIP